MLLWPFKAVWKIAGLIFDLVGNLLAIILGLAFVIVGVLLTLTLVGAIVGIPMIIFGTALMLRGLF